jgi:hypothetical protein
MHKAPGGAGPDQLLVVCVIGQRSCLQFLLRRGASRLARDRLLLRVLHRVGRPLGGSRLFRDEHSDQRQLDCSVSAFGMEAPAAVLSKMPHTAEFADS